MTSAGAVMKADEQIMRRVSERSVHRPLEKIASRRATMSFICFQCRSSREFAHCESNAPNKSLGRRPETVRTACLPRPVEAKSITEELLCFCEPHESNA